MSFADPDTGIRYGEPLPDSAAEWYARASDTLAEIVEAHGLTVAFTANGLDPSRWRLREPGTLRPH